MIKIGLGDVSFLNNLVGKNPSETVYDGALKDVNLNGVATSKLSKLLENEPLLAYVILDKLGWKTDHAARAQIAQVVKDINGAPIQKHEMEPIINTNAAIIAHNHEQFKIAFKDNPQLVDLYPFSKRKNIEILAYSIDQYCDLSSYEDYEIGYKIITSVACSDFRMRTQRDMLINEGYDVDIISISLEDADTKMPYYHTWLFNNYRNGNLIIRKININNLIKTK